MNHLAQALRDVFREMSRLLAQIFRDLSIFPTTLAAVLTPVLGISVRVEGPRRGSIEERIEQITGRLQESGRDAQSLLIELEQLMAARSQQLMDAQATLLKLQLEESEVQERVDALKSVRPEAARAIAGLMDESLAEREKRGQRRDWLIFAMGVIGSGLVSLVFFIVSR